MNKKNICDFCNESFESLMKVESYEICEDCLIEQTTECYCCGERVFTEDMEIVYSHESCEDVYVCNGCYDDRVSTCDCCEHTFLRRELRTETNHFDEDVDVCEECFEERCYYCDYHDRHEIDTSRWEDGSLYVSNYGRICTDAYENGEFTYCEDCEELYHYDDLVYIEHEDRSYCHDCAETHEDNGYITSYHDHDYDEKFVSKKEFEEDVDLNQTLFFGVELEVEKTNRKIATDRARMSEILYDIDEHNILAFEQDSSLYDGFEIITQPLSFEYIKENKDFFIDMMNKLKSNGFDSFNTNTCGHHIHISKSPFTEIQQVLFVAVFEFFRQEFTALSRRDESKLERWSNFITRNYDKDQLNNSEVFESLLNILFQQHNRYRAVNVCNTHTLEARIWRGTTSASEYLFRIELMYNVAMYVKENTEELNNMVFGSDDLFKLNFYDIITYKSNEFVHEYLEAKECLVTV